MRISHLRDVLNTLVDLDLVAGYRGARRTQLAKYTFGGRLRGLDGIYVESSTFLPAETDLAFLGLAKALRIPILTYIRDAYQLFDDYGSPASLKQRLSARAFRPMIAALRAVSTHMAFPSAGLAKAVLGDARDATDAILLPPGAPAPVAVARDNGANRLLFVGDARLPAQGGDRLVQAVNRARVQGAAVELDVVSRPGQEPEGPHPDWLHLHRASGEAIHALLPQTLATVIPRPRNPYNDLALPIKLFDYLSYGRPLLVTDCTEQARIVRQANAGIVVGDTVEGMSAGFVHLLQTDADQLDAWSAHAAEAARRSAWSTRARKIVEILTGGEA
ncbi:MAG: glycosyltransferase [Candidatus Limnocylindria bacterium]